MIERILKLELFTLFFTTLVSFFVFYYSDSLPDHLFKISGAQEEIGYFSYYVTSFFVLIEAFSGPWIFVPFAVHVAFYSFYYSKRESNWDTLNVLWSIIFFAFTFNLMAPSFLGKGLRYLLSYPEIWFQFALIGASFFAFCFGTFRQSFHKFILQSWMGLKDGIKWMRTKKVKAAIPTKREPPKAFVPPVIKKEENSIPSFIATPREEKISSPKAPETEERPIPLKRQQVNGEEDENLYKKLVGDLSQGRKESRVNHPDEKYFEEIIELIEDKLSEFKIEGKIINVLKGPVVDTFELELGSGVKVSKVTGATEDLSLALYGAPIRIVYPMKGRTTVGIEVPRNPREIIYLDEVLSNKDFQSTRYTLPVAMGKDAFGETFIVDLGAMPHMLVAGATGAGKSVFINTLLVSLLVKKSPRQMKLILIDPKQLELALYQQLPHLIMPVITDAKTASIALLWAVQEMERRYTILKEFGVRNIAGFNEKLAEATPSMLANIHQHYLDQGSEDYELPYLVVIVDEFADLILTKAGKEIEQNISRLAAKARAAGIHLVLATQRPSVDVITGVIKSNFPTRVSFRVTSPTDSRTILDKMGAEKLLGKGDMLYKSGVETTRVHSAYVEEKEIELFTEKLTQMDQQFNPHAMEFIENGGDVEIDEYTYGTHVIGIDDKAGDDAIYNEAVKVVAEHRSASASMLQRRLRIGYNRAANLIEEMETKGIVGPAQGSRPRKVLISSEDVNRVP